MVMQDRNIFLGLSKYWCDLHEVQTDVLLHIPFFSWRCWYPWMSNPNS